MSNTIYPQTGGMIQFTNQDFISEGGQGKVYAKNGLAYKIYHDHSKMIPLGKIDELRQLTDPCFIKPEQVMLNKKGTPIGYSMKLVSDGKALCALFPPAFKKRNNISTPQIHDLVRQIQSGFLFAHSKKILIVDANEFNFLVNPTFDNVFFIDADSYQTEHYPAQAIMQSVRDWHTQGFNESTDWFSFGVISFQLLTGIGPYRGTYTGKEDQFKKKLPSDDPKDDFAITRRRMQHNISIYHPDVEIPQAYRNQIAALPKGISQWYEAIFEQGKRGAPPNDFGAVVVFAPVIKPMGSNHLDIREFGEFHGNILNIWFHYNDVVVTTDQGTYHNGQLVSGRPILHVGFSPRQGHALGFIPLGNEIEVLDMNSRTSTKMTTAGSNHMNYDGRVYMKSKNNLLEIKITDAGTRVVTTASIVAGVMEHATQIFQGCAFQNMLGATYVSVLPKSGSNYQKHLPELDGYRITNAKYDNHVLMVVGEKQGKYDRLIFRYADNFRSYELFRVVEDVLPSDLNFVTLDTGVCVLLNEEDKLEVFRNQIGSTTVKIVEDPLLNNEMTLTKKAGQLLFFKENKVYSMRLK